MNITAYPLYWPEGWKRTQYQEYSRFGRHYENLTVARSTTRLLDELRKMGVPNNKVIISTNLKLRQDGLPYSNLKSPDDTGVSVWWVSKKEQKVIALDKYVYVADNLHAVAKTIEALRGIERWGGGEILNRTFKGFVALPSNTKSWREALGYHGTDRDELNTAFKKARAKAHPDKEGGSHEAFILLSEAYNDALDELY